MELNNNTKVSTALVLGLQQQHEHLAQLIKVFQFLLDDEDEEALVHRVPRLLPIGSGLTHVHIRKTTAPKLYEALALHGDFCDITEANMDEVLNLPSETDRSETRLAKMNQRIPKNHFNTYEIIAVNMLHADGPDQFYVIKSEQIEEKRAFVDNLNTHYRYNKEDCRKLFMGYVHTPCAVCIDDMWYRAAIKAVKERGKFAVYLVDEGKHEIIDWRQAFVLQDQFLNRSEFATCCTLANYEPLQNDSSAYTSTYIKAFKQMDINTYGLLMTVVDNKSFGYTVLLYITINNSKIDIGAFLMQNKYAVSTEAITQYLKLPRICKKTITDENDFRHNSRPDWDSLSLKPKHRKNFSTSVLAVRRTPVNVLHLVSPGEFYIQLSELSPCFKDFHLQIQESQNKKYPSLGTYLLSSGIENIEWSINDHCLVYSTYGDSTTQQGIMGPTTDNEWYRGIIQDITFGHHHELQYSVFLRDIGATIKSGRNHLFSIDLQFDRVTDAVVCCHLSCIEPAGGNSWSLTSIDLFRDAINNFESLSASIHNKRLAEQSSLPVVLWGSIIQTVSDFAPSITNYLNLNQDFIDSGLAYMAKHCDLTKQFDLVEEIAVSEGTITVEEWFQLFGRNEPLCGYTHFAQQPEHLGNFTVDDDVFDGEIEGVASSHPLSVYLTEFDLTPTTGQSHSPPAWASSKDIFKTLFAGYPTYVDSNGIVYLHEADDKQFLETMSSIITENVSDVPQTDTNYKFTIGQPVVARYLGGQNFYRAIIESEPNDEGELTVCFIDYGNTNQIKPEYIRTYAPFPNLPSIANKFQIRGIQPKNGAAAYTQDDLNKMHMQIVCKLLSVRVTDISNTIKVCDMRLGNADVASTFIKQRLVDKAVKFNSPLTSECCNLISKGLDSKESNTVYEVFVDNEPDFTLFSCRTSYEDTIKSDYLNDLNEDTITSDCLNDLIGNLVQNPDSKQLPPSQTLTSRSVQHQSEVTYSVPFLEKRMRNDGNYMQFLDNIEDTNSDISNFDHNSDMDMVKGSEGDIKQQKQTEAIFQTDDDNVSEFERFHPNYSSTPLLNISSVELFRTPQWPRGLIEFNCRVIYVFTPTVLQIYPKHFEFKQRRIELQRDIKHKVKTALPLGSCEVGMTCLAYCSKNNKWHRGIIRSYNKITKTVDVVYIDYMCYVTLNIKHVRQCPSGVMDWPLCSFLVRLFGVEENPRIRDHELRSALQKQLFRRNLYALVKKPGGKKAFSAPNNNDLMQISLYRSPEFAASNITAYDSLISTDFFRCT